MSSNQASVSRIKLILMNLAVAVAILYRWLHGAPTSTLAVWGLIMFPLVNGLLFLAAKNSALSRK